MRRIRRHLSFANVASAIALFVAISGGTAVALSGTNTVFSDDIVDNQVFSADVRNDTLSGGGLAALDLRPNSVGSSEVTNNSLGLGDLAPAARGARAYGAVGPGNFLHKSKNVTAVSNPSSGLFCITLASNINLDGAVLVVSPDFATTGTSAGSANPAHVEWYGGSPGGVGCPSGTAPVLTFTYNGDETDDDDGGGNTTGDNLVASNQGFSFVVP
jgi:hypothetical protein